MSVQSKATLKSYFETGDKPTQANFEDLIDSLLDQSDGIKNGGNSFGADASLGTNDNFNLIIRTNNATRWTVREDGRIQKTGTTSSLTHDIATGTIGATGYSGTLITFGNNLTLNANSKIVVVDDLVPNSAGTANLGTSSLQFGVVYSHNLFGRTYTGTNTAGINLLIASSIGTGNSTPTSIVFQTPSIGTSGSTGQTLATQAYVDYNAFYFNVPIRSVNSIQLLDTTYKTALDVSAANTLRVGNSFSTVNILPALSTGSTISAGSDISTPSGNAFYFGSSTVDGTWRLIRSGNDLIIQRRVSGTYVTKNTISSSAGSTRFSGFAHIQVSGSGYHNISSSTLVTLNNGAGTNLTVTLPNDSSIRTFLMIGIASYENGNSNVSIIKTSIYDGTSTIREALTDLRNDQDDLVLQHVASITCTGQTISLQAKLDTGNTFSFNGGSLSIIEIS